MHNTKYSVQHKVNFKISLKTSKIFEWVLTYFKDISNVF